MTDTDTTNAVSYRIVSSVLGSHHQGDSRFGATAGVQCACNSLFALCWSVISNVCQWYTFDLDYVLCESDSNYKLLNTLNLLAADELPNVVQTADGRMFLVEYLSLENGEVSAHSQEFPFLRGIHNACVDKGVGFLMFISGFTIAVIPYLDSYYLFDSHIRNGQGLMITQGKSVLQKFAGLQDIEKYVQVVYLQERNLNHAYF